MHRDAGRWRHGGGTVPSALSKGGQWGWRCLSHNSTIGRAGLRGGQRGQLPRAPRCKGAPRDEIYLFQIKYSVEKFS